METRTDVGAAYVRAIEQATRVVQGIRPDQLESATPCREWNTRQLLTHLVGSNLMMAAARAGKHVPTGMSGTEHLDQTGDALGDDPRGAYRSNSSQAHAAC